MPFGPGVRVGPYQIVAAIGAGGMGEVYRARDTKLARDVALKVLPPAFAADPDRLARMHREAQLLAALNDPHIAAIHGLEESGGTPALVLEFVDGETLADRIGRGPLPVDEAMPLARQMTEALAAAHEQGIVHRDLKPANIKVRPDGMVKVLDFGLAKFHELDVPGGPSGPGAQSMSPTVHATMAGVLLGTAPYMSPEQARGRAVDRRTDIWAFGCVPFEMLTGRRAFQGEDVAETVAAVVKSEPDWALLPAATPAHVRQLLRLCLEKDPHRRIRDISAAQLVLDGAFAVSAAAPGPSPRSRRRRITALAAAAFVAGGAIATGVVRGLGPTQSAPVAQFVIPKPPEEGRLTFTPAAPMLAISRDGERVVYRAVGDVGQALYLRDSGRLEFIRLPGTDNSRNPFFSPDGEWVAFSTVQLGDARAELKRVSVHGGSAQTICVFDGDLRGAAWLDDNTIVFASSASGGLRRVPASGGTLQEVTAVDAAGGEGGHFWPAAVPGGRQVLFTVWNGTLERSHISAVSLADGRVSTLVSGATFPRFMASGHLVFAVGDGLRAVPFTPGQTSVSGAPLPVVRGVATANTGAAHYEVSDRSLVYLGGLISDSDRLRLASFNRQGMFEPLTPPAAAFELPRVAPDGRRLAYGTTDEGAAIIWVYDLSGASAARRLTLDGRNRYPVWSADGKSIAFQSDRDGDLGIFRQRADGAGAAERLTTAEAGAAHIPESWSPDGAHLLYNVVSKDGVSALRLVNVATGQAEPFGNVTSPLSTLTGAVFSPDGKWVAYASSDRRQASAVYVQPFPATGARYQISNDQDDAHHPVWAPDGSALYFTPGPGGRMHEVKVFTQPTFTFGEATTFPGPFANIPPNLERPYDISRDGLRFIGLANATSGQQPGSGQEPQIRVVLNWAEELKRLVPAK